MIPAEVQAFKDETLAKVCLTIGGMLSQSTLCDADVEEIIEVAERITESWLMEEEDLSKEEWGYVSTYAERKFREDYIKHTKADPVNPQHYQQGEIECIDAIESAVINLQGIEAFCTGNAIKYLWRWKEKNGNEDLRKAKWYIEKLMLKEWRDESKR